MRYRLRGATKHLAASKIQKKWKARDSLTHEYTSNAFWVHRNESSHCYDVAKLVRYIFTSGDMLDAVTRTPFTRQEIAGLQMMAGVQLNMQSILQTRMREMERASILTSLEDELQTVSLALESDISMAGALLDVRQVLKDLFIAGPSDIDTIISRVAGQVESRLIGLQGRRILCTRQEYELRSFSSGEQVRSHDVYYLQMTPWTLLSGLFSLMKVDILIAAQTTEDV